MTLPGHPLPLETIEKIIQRRWHRLVQAEQQGQPTEVLERLYQSYQRAVEQYAWLSQQSDYPLVS